MSWGLDLWDQYESVCAHTDQGIEFVKRVASFVEKRVHVELSYAKDLRKLVKQNKRRDDEESKYSLARGFSKLVRETDDLAGQRELIAEYLQAEVLEPLKLLARDVTTERRKHLGEGTELLRQLKVSMETLERTKKSYEKASEEAENAMHTLEKADNDPNSTKAKIDKLTVALRQKENTAEESRNTYILQLEQTNGKRRQHYNTEMPQVFQNLQNMNGARIDKCKELLATYADSHRKVHPVINTCLDSITEAADSVDPNRDNQQLIDDIKTGFPIPKDVAFEEYQGKHSRAKPKKPGKTRVEPREDYGHLPPEQRRRKLSAKVDELEGAVGKALSDKTAMEKMLTVYTQNPQLGDAKTVTQQLEQTHAKIGDLNAELEKFKGWLAIAESQGSLAPNTAHGVGPSPKAVSPKLKKKEKDKKKEKGKAADSERAPSPPPPPLPPALTSTNRGSNEWSSDGEEEGEDSNIIGYMLYDFQGQNEDEISVYANDQVVVLEDLGDGWLRVQKDQEEGYVPQSYVQLES